LYFKLPQRFEGKTCPSKRFYTYLSHPVEFIGCGWNDIILADGPGGAIYFERDKQDTDVYVLGCSFTNIDISGTSQPGGALYISHILSALICSNVFENVKAKDGGAGYVAETEYCLLVHNCSLDGCSAKEAICGLRCLSSENILFSVYWRITIGCMNLCGIENEKMYLLSSEYRRYQYQKSCGGK
jgi:hypothetical protein